MKALTLCVLGCAMVFLATALDPPEAPVKNNQTNETVSTELDKRTVSCCGRYCYYYISRLMTWAQAEWYCLCLGGHLASVHSYGQYRVLQGLVRKSTCRSREVWIGGSNAQQSNIWLWSDGTRFRYTNWCRGEPNNYGRRQYCLQMNHSARKCWDDFECWRYRPSICAKRRW